MNSISTSMGTLQKRIYLRMDLTIVPKTYTFSRAGSFQNLFKISILFSATKSQFSRSVKARKRQPGLICYGNWKFPWSILFKCRTECTRQKIRKISFWQKRFYYKQDQQWSEDSSSMLNSKWKSQQDWCKKKLKKKISRRGSSAVQKESGTHQLGLKERVKN